MTTGLRPRGSPFATARSVSTPASSRVFEAFYTTKPEGMGMGLAINRSIIEAHSGRLWAEATASGAIFCFRLPAATAPA
jgi:signal transduction histidine kinase